MLKQILSPSILQQINYINYSTLYEVRLRLNQPLIVNICGENKVLDYIVKQSDIEYVLNKCSNDSLYTVNDQITNGYICMDRGVRVGVCGEIVTVDGKIKTIKNITSLNIRVPHFIKNCSLNIFNQIVYGGKINNTLIIYPPGMGKTTMLRDIIYQLGLRTPNYNILIADERNEIAIPDLPLKNADIFVRCSKKYAFVNGLRSMRPDILVTDEINYDNDIETLLYATTCGVKVIATMHAKNIDDIRNRPNMQYIINNKLFDRYIILSDTNGVGSVDGVYNANLECVFIWNIYYFLYYFHYALVLD